MSMQKTLAQLAIIAAAYGNTGLFSPFAGLNNSYNDTGVRKRACLNCGKEIISDNAFCSKECFIETRKKQQCFYLLLGD